MSVSQSGLAGELGQMKDTASKEVNGNLKEDTYSHGPASTNTHMHTCTHMYTSTHTYIKKKTLTVHGENTIVQESQGRVAI